MVDAEGRIWTGVDDGRIVRISPDSGESGVVANTGGRPLGLHVARDGRLLICDSPRGLLAMDTATGEIETLAAEFDGRKLRFCSNVTETVDGAIYFTESTSAFTYADYMAALLEARGRGSLLLRDPDGTVPTAASGARSSRPPIPSPTSWRKGRRWYASWFGGYRSGGGPSRSPWSGSSRSTLTPALRSRACGQSIPNSAKWPGWRRRTAGYG